MTICLAVAVTFSRSFEALLEGKTELEVFGPDVPADAGDAETPAAGSERLGRDAPRTLPRPGLAGAETRGLELPEKPELA